MAQRARKQVDLDTRALTRQRANIRKRNQHEQHEQQPGKDGRSKSVSRLVSQPGRAQRRQHRERKRPEQRSALLVAYEREARRQQIKKRVHERRIAERQQEGHQREQPKEPHDRCPPLGQRDAHQKQRQQTHVQRRAAEVTRDQQRDDFIRRETGRRKGIASLCPRGQAREFERRQQLHRRDPDSKRDKDDEQ